MRWMNFHLAEAGVSQRVNNFGPDMVDSTIYLHVMSRIDPEKKATATVLTQTADKLERAKAVVGHGQRMGAEFRVKPQGDSCPLTAPRDSCTAPSSRTP